MRSHLKFFIDGQWVEPSGSGIHEVINPATETVAGKVAMGAAADVDRAVAAARRAFGSYSQASREERLALLERISAGMAGRAKDLHAALTEEMGSPTCAAEQAHVPVAMGHFAAAINQLKKYEFEEQRGIRPDGGAFIGPVVNASQWKRIQGYIQSGIDEGAQVLVGGADKPEGLETGYYVKPTVFTHVTADMRIAKEEIFGPVLVIIPYDDEEDAVRIANDSPYGLAAYVHSKSLDKARAVGARIRAGQVYLNGVLNLFDSTVPFGGCKCSGNGREGGVEGLESFLEDIAFLGYAPEAQAA